MHGYNDILVSRGNWYGIQRSTNQLERASARSGSEDIERYKIKLLLLL